MSFNQSQKYQRNLVLVRFIYTKAKQKEENISTLSSIDEVLYERLSRLCQKFAVNRPCQCGQAINISWIL